MGILDGAADILTRDISRILDNRPEKLRRQTSSVNWHFEYISSLEGGWLIRGTNLSSISAQLNVQAIEFYTRDNAVQELVFLTHPLVNPGESVDLKFSVRFEGKLVPTGGELSIRIVVPAGDELRLRYATVSLPDLEIR